MAHALVLGHLDEVERRLSVLEQQVTALERLAADLSRLRAVGRGAQLQEA